MTCGTSSQTPETPDGSSAAPFILKKGRWFGVLVTVRTSTGATQDLTDYTGRAQMRRLVADVGTPVATFTVTKRNQTLYRGKADVTLGADVSETGADPEIPVGDYVADVEFENDADPGDVIASDVFYVRVTGEVTKD